MRAIPRLAVAFVEIQGKTGKYKANIADVKRRTTQFGKSATKSIKAVTIGITAMGVAAAAAATIIAVKLTRALARAGKASIVAAVRYDRLKIGLAAVAGGSREAEKQLRRLEEVAKLPGLSFEGAIAGSTALQAAGLNAMLAERSLLAFGNALVTVGKGADDLKGVNLALTQIVTKGQGFGQELRQLAERLPQIRKAMKDAFGIGSVEDFQKLGLSATEFIEGIVEEFEKLPKVTGTVSNELENLGIAFDRLKAEIGKTMLDATSNVAKSLTQIVDKLRIIVDSYGLFREEAIRAMLSITVIAVRATTEMMKGIGAIITATAPLVFLPLKNAASTIFKEITTGLALSLNEVFKKLGLIDTRQFEDNIVNLVNNLQNSTNRASANMQKKFEEAAENAARAFEEQIPFITQTLMDALAGVDAVLERLAARARQLNEFKAGIRGLFEGFVGAFNKVSALDKALADLISKRGKAKELEFLVLKTEDPKKIEARLRESQKRILAFNDGIGKEMRNRQEINLANFREFLDESRRIAEEAADAIRPAFENLFENLFSGNTKNLWAQFWDDLKRIAIRKMAAVFATQLLAGLFTGGTSFAATGIGSILSSLAPSSIDPTSRAIGSGISRGASAVGGFLEGGGNTFVFNQTDFANMDPVRLAKTASQQIAPALAEEAVDGR